jgi:hypothetical protein
VICGKTALLVAIWWFILLTTRYPERTIRNVYRFFHRMGGEILLGEFHPDPEADFKALIVRVNSRNRSQSPSILKDKGV